MRFVLPGDIDDASAPSGGNVYDRRLCDALAFEEVAVPGAWPQPDAIACAALDQALGDIPDGETVLLDGLVACGVPEVVVPHARRLRLAVLVHLPLADETGLDPHTAARLDAAEREVLRAASAVIATSPWARRRLEEHHGLTGVNTVTPGTDPAALAPGTDGVSRLLCVASLTPRKGQDVLVEALRPLVGLPWTCELVGPGHAEIDRLDGRIRVSGPLVGAALDAAYAAADLFVLPSRAETYGMVVTEALARGIPVVASSVPDALGRGGVLLPPGDAGALTRALRRWLTDEQHRRDLRHRALKRRAELSTWDETARAMTEVLASLRA
ncbi:glycosyltransferase family 4 protein [Lentzea sp. NBRC 105346]|uniref:glycosyltransferase family 4 protein n=1 Tax=Lentzea sp. NBRC 105346 TaxID=3032205 RepID=UPI00255703E3|nr:glycosyltransferase family 4 protein [Lentzea sp. NBRC 105346]